MNNALYLLHHSGLTHLTEIVMLVLVVVWSSKGGKARGAGGRLSPLSHKHSKTNTDKMADKEGRRRHHAPFHRRSTINDLFVGNQVGELH